MRHVKYLLFLIVPVLVLTSDHLQAEPPVYGYQVVHSHPHDTSAFTQGLVLVDGRLYESTGLYGSSSLREVDLTTGTVLRKVDVPSQYFAEGMTIFQGKVIQLTWQSQIGFIYDPATFNQIGQFFYSGEGWGLTHDDRYLIMSDGTNRIRFLDPASFQVVRSIDVFNEGSPLTSINELEYINGEIYANIWRTNWIVRIDPASGAVTGWIDLTGLLPSGTSADVLNGIAYEPASGHLLVTGKLWPWLFEISVVGNSNSAPVAEPQSISALEDTPRDVVLTASDADGDVLTFSVVAGPAHGTLSGAPPFLSYAPARDYAGSDSFTFRVDDGVASATAAVSILVAPVNDPPIAAGDAYDADANGSLSVAAPGVLSNDGDVDGDPLSAILMSWPSHGSLSFSANGSFVYTPFANYTGPDSFTYLAYDGAATSPVAAVSLTITGSAPVPGPPPTPAVSLSPTTLSFGNQAVGTSSAARTATLTNSGTGPLIISSITATGTNAADFAQSNTCGSSLPPGAACAISVTFTPTGTGQRRGAIAIVDDAGGSPHLIALSGAGKKGRLQ